MSIIATYLDLNSLHDLACTCRQIRANLLQYRAQLIRFALRCENDASGVDRRLNSPNDGYSDERRNDVLEASNLEPVGAVSGQMREEVDQPELQPDPSQRRRIRELGIGLRRISRCAMDMVGECRRCGRVVCRVWLSLFLVVVYHLFEHHMLKNVILAIELHE